jgi:hypothetical protein
MKKSRQTLILIAIYALALGSRVYWFSQKDGLHVDEGLTIAIACCNDFMVTNNYEYGKKYTGKELKEASLVSSAGLKDALADVRSLWKDNRDPPHTNLYYTFLRLSLIGIKTGDIAPIVFRGGILNLLFFTVSFIFFFLLMRLLFAEYELLQYAAVFCAFLSTASISNTLFLRPYQIQETLFIMLCYYFVLSLGWKKYIINENKLFVSVKPIALMSLLTALTLMSGYYALLFIGLFGLYAVYLNCKNRTFTEIPYYFAVLCLGVLLAGILYPKYISGFFSYRGKETIRTLSRDMTGNIQSSIKSGAALLQKHFFYIPVIIVCVLCLAYIIFMLIREYKLIGLVQKLRNIKLSAVKKMTWFIFAASVIYLFIVLIAAPYKIIRYGMPVFPFFAILPAMLIEPVGVRHKKIAACAILLLCAFFAFNAARESKIENLFRNKPDQYVFTKDKDTPVYVINNGSWSLWKYANLIPYIHDEQAYYFIDWYKYLGEILRTGEGNVDIPLPEAEGYSSIYLLIEYFPDFQRINDLIAENIQTVQGAIENEFEINTGEPESWFPYFKGKKINMDNS